MPPLSEMIFILVTCVVTIAIIVVSRRDNASQKKLQNIEYALQQEQVEPTPLQKQNINAPTSFAPVWYASSAPLLTTACLVEHSANEYCNEEDDFLEEPQKYSFFDCNDENINSFSEDEDFLNKDSDFGFNAYGEANMFGDDGYYIPNSMNDNY